MPRKRPPRQATRPAPHPHDHPKVRPSQGAQRAPMRTLLCRCCRRHRCRRLAQYQPSTPPAPPRPTERATPVAQVGRGGRAPGTPPLERHPWCKPHGVHHHRPLPWMPPHGGGATRPPTEHCQPRCLWQTRRPSRQTRHSPHRRHGPRREWLRRHQSPTPPRRQRRHHRRPLAEGKLPALPPLHQRQPPPPNRQKCQRQHPLAQVPWRSPSSPPPPPRHPRTTAAEGRPRGPSPHPPPSRSSRPPPPLPAPPRTAQPPPRRESRLPQAERRRAPPSASSAQTRPLQKHCQLWGSLHQQSRQENRRHEQQCRVAAARGACRDRDDEAPRPRSAADPAVPPRFRAVHRRCQWLMVLERRACGVRQGSVEERRTRQSPVGEGGGLPLLGRWGETRMDSGSRSDRQEREQRGWQARCIKRAVQGDNLAPGREGARRQTHGLTELRRAGSGGRRWHDHRTTIMGSKQKRAGPTTHEF